MLAIEERDGARAAARAHETSLPARQRKFLGQFFTGMQLGRLLAHLALDADTRTVLDPMAGHGDLLDAVLEAAEERSIAIDRLDGIEIDYNTASVCRNRLSELVGVRGEPTRRILAGNAFDPDLISRLRRGGYDMVITNPPYVRYQARKGRDLSDGDVRAGLESIVRRFADVPERDTWLGLTRGYSGLADLSVPSWLLAGLLVRPGGRLALVAPATWRSREYADVVRYMLLRCFKLEYVVEDTQSGWFDGALVRTHLVVAKRLPAGDVARPLHSRTDFSSAGWIMMSSEASGGRSLVGGVFGGKNPEAGMIEWLRSKPKEVRPGISVSKFDLRQERESLRGLAGAKKWSRRLEGATLDTGMAGSSGMPSRLSLPDVVGKAAGGSVGYLVTLEEAGIRVGQGLRTGCNRFFYVTARSAAGDGLVRVRSSPALGGKEFTVPDTALRPILQRQSDVATLRAGQPLPGRVLDLRDWALPEDVQITTPYLDAYRAAGKALPRIMPDELADFVRRAAKWFDDTAAGMKRIPDMAAVRTNVRMPSNADSTPRFWYMLPDFTPRHTPSAFVARVNHGHPWTEANLDPPILIDANFCTLWPARDGWTGFGLKALLNSAWCRALMEALGTRLGGGALKLEAAHLRRVLVPRFSREDRKRLHEAGKSLGRDSLAAQRRADDIVLGRVLGSQAGEQELVSASDRLTATARALLFKRRRPTH